MQGLNYSQNFLHNPKLVQKLLDISSITKEDIVLEIGSGKGIITEALANKCKSVIAVEADEKLYKGLSERFSVRNVELHCSDFIQYRLPNYDYKVFSNIPFNLTADIIKKLSDAKNPPTDSYLFVQKEAATKYAGNPYGKETLFSILHKPWFNFSVIYRFQRKDFYPIPHIDIVLLRINKLQKPLVDIKHNILYSDFISHGFISSPLLKKSYAKVFSNTQFLKLANNLHFDRMAKPTDLNFEQWLGMFNYFLIGVDPIRRYNVQGATQKALRQQKGLTKIHRTRNAKNWKQGSAK